MIINISICCIISLIAAYIFIGCLICNGWIQRQNEERRIKGGMKKRVNQTKRILFRLSIILFYPIYIIALLILYAIELLTEDEPFN